MNKKYWAMSVLLGGVIILSSLICFGQGSFWGNYKIYEKKSQDYKKFEKYKKYFEVNLKMIDGDEVNKMFGVQDAGTSSYYYISGNITHKLGGRVYIKLRINVLNDDDNQTTQYSITTEFNLIRSDEKCYFLLYLGDLHPCGYLNAKFSYDIINILSFG